MVGTITVMPMLCLVVYFCIFLLFQSEQKKDDMKNKELQELRDKEDLKL